MADTIASLQDLLIVDGDLAFGPDGEPVITTGIDVVAQDVGHRVRESGTPPLLVADSGAGAEAYQAIALAVEGDERVRPGTATVEGPDDLGNVTIRATAMDGQSLTVES